MRSTATTKLIDWCRAQDALWLDENPRAAAIEIPLIREPRPEQPLNFGGQGR